MPIHHFYKVSHRMRLCVFRLMPPSEGSTDRVSLYGVTSFFFSTDFSIFPEDHRAVCRQQER